MAVKVAEQSPHKALEALQAELASRQAAHASHQAAWPADNDISPAASAHRADGDGLARLVREAEVAVAFQRGVVEKAEAEAADKANKAISDALKHEAVGAIAEAIQRIIDRSELMRPDLQFIVDHRERVDAANANPAIRKFGHIVDGERLARERPGGEVSEIRGEVEVWHDANGRRPSQYREKDGQAFALDGSPLRRAKESYVVRAAGFDPGHMPARLAEVIKLVNLDGKPLWARD